MHFSNFPNIEKFIFETSLVFLKKYMVCLMLHSYTELLKIQNIERLQNLNEQNKQVFYLHYPVKTIIVSIVPNIKFTLGLLLNFSKLQIDKNLSPSSLPFAL